MKSVKYTLDDVLGKLTMYHVVVQGLVLLCVAAFVLMTTGYLDYSPLAFVASIILLTGGSYAANRLFGWLFGVRPHGESAVITGLILALLFTPPVSIIAGIKLLLVAVIAMASKYILAIRGKHIFNPAAIAIVIASIGELAFASWWVATPALLPFALIAALLILYKTQKLMVAALFLAVALPLILVQTALAGPLNAQTILVAITSWPLVFFAGVMLSEPQTLPPRRKQQYIVAVVVAVLMVIPFHYASIVMTPALALVLGNLLAFYFGIRRGVTLRLVSKKQIGTNGYELTFDTKPISFIPGQYIELTLPHKGMDVRGMRRVFTIIGQPDSEQVSIATRLPEKASSFKKALVHMKVGKIIHGTRIAGDFVLPGDAAQPIIFIAGGIGITPLLSFLMTPGKRDITLLYAVSSLDDLLYVKELMRYDVHVCVVSPETGTLPDPSWQLVVGRLSADIISAHVDAASQSAVYISGPPRMVEQTKEWVKNQGITTIHTDHFSGY